MSYNPEVLKRLNELCDLYQKRWGKPVDFVGVPGSPAFKQENLVRILERIVDTGESIIVGFDKLRGEIAPFIMLKWLCIPRD